MAQAGSPLILREGWLYAALAAVVALLIQQFSGWLAALPLWLAAAGLLFLFRNPDREIPPAPLAVVSPADGRIESVADCRDPYLSRDAICISIQGSILGPYVTRSPIEGKVQQRWRASDSRREGSAANPSDGLWIQTDEGDDVVLVMARRAALRAPRCYPQSGQRVGQGQRCGHVPFGAQVHLFLPASTRVDVREGDHVRAGADSVATLVHK
jgi:phosphatidylserine decarboxylase